MRCLVIDATFSGDDKVCFCQQAFDIKKLCDNLKARVKLSSNEQQTCSKTSRCTTSRCVADVLSDDTADHICDFMHRGVELLNFVWISAFLWAEHPRDALWTAEYVVPVACHVDGNIL